MPKILKNILANISFYSMTSCPTQLHTGGVPNAKMSHNLPFRNKITIKIQKFDHT